ncbi:MAG TPA: long-chain fatty acid--CoA ligase [Terriglobales bacterium]|nr:long-chain fatty acid--CoA ligase [Terriglobales bacterium]
MALNTINDVFYTVVERNSDRVMMYKQGVKWIPISSHELYRDVLGVARSLEQWGIRKGDRVAILSENRPEWAVADFATQLLGAVVVPIYGTLTAEQTAYILKDSGARVIFLSTADQLKKFSAAKEQTVVEKAVIMDYAGIPDAVPMHRLMHDGPAERDNDFDARARAVSSADLATIIYTSGTTGVPKGAMLTHGNLASNIEFSLREVPVSPGDLGVSFLPLAHVTARHVDYAWLYRGVTVAYCPSIEQLPTTLQEVRPTIFVGVPRVYEKMYAQVQLKVQGGWKRSLYNWALKVGHAHRGETLEQRRPASLSWRLADKLIFSKVRNGMGGRVQIYLSGGAPLARQMGEWFADTGIRLDEGYGLTETSPVIAVNTPAHHKLGSVGRPLPNVQVKIAEDGEILVRGPSVFQGYWNLPEQTSQALVDGWFHTGDIGNLDSEGFLSVTDRKKDLLKTSGGKFITPQPIEKSLQMSPWVAEAVVLGDRRKFPAAIIAPDFRLLEAWARNNGVRFTSRDELVADPAVRGLYQTVITEINANLARYEQIKKFLLIPEEFSVANGLLTASMKLRRRQVEERYRQQIDALYADPAPQIPVET